MHTYFLEQINTKEDGLNHDKMVVHCPFFSLSRAQSGSNSLWTFQRSGLLFLSRPPFLELFGYSSGGATPGFLHLLDLNLIWVKRPVWALDITQPYFFFLKMYFLKSLLNGKWSCFVTCDWRAQANRLDYGRTSFGKQKSEAKHEKR